MDFPMNFQWFPHGFPDGCSRSRLQGAHGSTDEPSPTPPATSATGDSCSRCWCFEFTLMLLYDCKYINNYTYLYYVFLLLHAIVILADSDDIL